MERGPLYNWHNLKSWDRNCLHPWCWQCWPSMAAGSQTIATCVWPSFQLLSSFHFLVHNTSLCICSLASFPTHFPDGRRETGYYPELLISQTACIMQQASLKIIEIITVVYFIHTHTYMFLYIYSSVSLCSWEMHPGFISVMRKGR